MDSSTFTTSSSRHRTPSSNGSFSFGGNSPGGREFTFTVANVDIPLPSVEFHSGSDTGSEPRNNYTTKPTSGFNPDNHLGTFSGAFDYPTRQRARSFTRGPVGAADSAPQLAAIRPTSSQLEGISMQELGTALHDVAKNPSKPTLKVNSAAPGRQSSAPPDLPPLVSSSDAHRVEDEVLLNDPFQNKELQDALSRSKELMAKLDNDLSSSSLVKEPESTIGRLRHRVHELAAFHCPATRIVGFVGDSGVGKSSLLNSLLDYKDLARANSSGVACTCVITEYHYHDATTFEIRIDAFSGEELETQIKDLVHKYRSYHRHRSTLEGPERQVCEEEADVAQDTLMTMFRTKLSNLDWIKNEPDVERVNNQLVGWATSYLGSQDLETQVLDSPKTCSARLQHLTSDMSSGNAPALWPFIRGVKVYLNSPILSRGIILVDLPGLRDLNAARRNNTERYLAEQKCHEVFAVCDISRATSDVGVKAVFELASKACLSSVGIVCTRTDVYRVDEAVNGWPGEVQDNIKDLRETRDSCQESEAEAEQQYMDLKSDQTPETRDERQRDKKLWDEWQTARDRVRAAKFNLQRCIIDTRNDDVSTKLVDKYGNQTSTRNDAQPDLKVFCVSNTLYWKERHKPASQYLPHLKLSGIQVMRQHFTSKVAESQLRLAKAYMQNHIPDVLRDLALWAERGNGTLGTERKVAIQKTLGEIEEQMEQELLSAVSKVPRLASELEEHYVQQIHSGTKQICTPNLKEPDLIKSQCSKFRLGVMPLKKRLWSGLAKFGHHSTPAEGERNWNEEAMSSMVNDLTGPIDGLIAFTASKETQVVDSFLKTTRTAEDKLNVHLGRYRATALSLIDALHSRQRQLTIEMSDLFNTCARQLSTLRTDTLSDIRTSQFGKELEEAYAKCRIESGPGSDRRRKAIIVSRMGDRTVFENMMLFLRRNLLQLSQSLEQQVKDILRGHLDVIIRTFDIIRCENSLEESEKDPHFTELLKGSVASISAELDEIYKVLE
ncbi:dynamin family domain-containing protein [Pochonia chlamydosporia 170]|uniref:Dynamin family domain-containing protein n=1 Tax=Pochonia chlamydosporia 170 TaxID=1380566 RepID=A0A179FRH1_METCM|nr:dynamin family domain-containing protein [Pochonia chlamydosporia 170]OAQ67731.2 dynamin family domain-containing protein [Pochonia chlamydosporia 170]